MADRRRRRKAQAEDAERALRYMQALQGKKIPLLTLDAKWHALFPDFRKTREIKRLEKELNRLIEKQGQTANDLLDYKKAKKVWCSHLWFPNRRLRYSLRSFSITGTILLAILLP